MEGGRAMAGYLSCVLKLLWLRRREEREVKEERERRK
jgi:hypothetical protein